MVVCACHHPRDNANANRRTTVLASLGKKENPIQNNQSKKVMCVAQATQFLKP
jgi:hypothetical protein